MQVGILKTDGGPHPADKWARMTALMLTNHLIDVDENSSSDLAIEMREARDELNLKVYRILKLHHMHVQSSERGAIQAQGDARLACATGPDEHVCIDDVVTAVVDEASLHPVLAAHFAKAETQEAIRAQLERDFGAVVKIERDWHAEGHSVDATGKAHVRHDHDPNDPRVCAYKQRQAAQVEA